MRARNHCEPQQPWLLSACRLWLVASVWLAVVATAVADDQEIADKLLALARQKRADSLAKMESKLAAAEAELREVADAPINRDLRVAQLKNPTTGKYAFRTLADKQAMLGPRQEAYDKAKASIDHNKTVMLVAFAPKLTLLDGSAGQEPFPFKVAKIIDEDEVLAFAPFTLGEKKMVILKGIDTKSVFAGEDISMIGKFMRVSRGTYRYEGADLEIPVVQPLDATLPAEATARQLPPAAGP